MNEQETLERHLKRLDGSMVEEKHEAATAIREVLEDLRLRDVDCGCNARVTELQAALEETRKNWGDTSVHLRRTEEENERLRAGLITARADNLYYERAKGAEARIEAARASIPDRFYQGDNDSNRSIIEDMAEALR